MAAARRRRNRSWVPRGTPPQAGLVTSLSTRTAIIGAINPRPGATITSGRPLSEITGLEGPLLSRFDLVLLLADPRHPEWDKLVAGHVLARRSLAASSDGAFRAESRALPGGEAQPLPLPAVCELAAPPPEPASVPDGSHGPGTGFPASQGSQPGGGAGQPDGSRMSIAQRVAARLAGGMPAAAPGATSWASTASRASWASEGQGLARTRDDQGAAAAASGGAGQRMDSRGEGSGSAWSLEVIRAYITWVRGSASPIMTPEVCRDLL
jgi:hypothetical protein